ncbi:MAG TPA: hypothetical protein VFR24_14545 [Candidatus Angelobacter sp.]|nr:hypothetical protein [Candidatus Angelobacter sp.]
MQDASPELIQFVKDHSALIAWVLGGVGAASLSLGGFVVKKIVDAVKQACEDLKHIKNIQGVQAENHLKTIQDASLAQKEEQIKTNAKLDVLISVIEKKL